MHKVASGSGMRNNTVPPIKLASNFIMPWVVQLEDSEWKPQFQFLQNKDFKQNMAKIMNL